MLPASYFLLFFFFLLSNLFFFFFLFWFWKQLPNLFLSLRSLLSCFQHSRPNHCPYLRTRKSYFLEASYIFCFFVVKLVLVTITKLVLSLRSSLLSCFQHSRTNHSPYIYSSLRLFLVFLQRCAVDDDDPTLKMAPSRSMTSSKNTDGAIKQEAKPTLIHEEDNGTTNTIEEGLNIGKRLSCTWTTGAGPRIGVLGDYSVELKIMALEPVNLSPMIKPGGVAFGSNSSSNIIPALPIPSPRLSPKIHLSPRLH